MEQNRTEILVETLGSIAWFAMDASWMLGGRVAAPCFAVPAVMLHVIAFRFTARSLAAWLVNGAMLAWVSMNVLWMGNDLQLTSSIWAAKICLGLGALMLVGALAVGRHDAIRQVFSRFRRLRLR